MGARGISAAIVQAHLALPRARVPDRRAVRAVAAYDEDAVTLAVAAALQVMENAGAPAPAAIVVASVSGPLVEGGIAGVLAEVLGATDDVVVQEHAGTVAAGGSALVAAATLVHAGVGPVLYVATDTRRDHNGRALGDGAVAALLDAAGADGALAEMTWTGSSAGLFRDTWRLDGDAHVSSADASLVPYGSAPHAQPADGDVDAVVTAGPATPVLRNAGALGCAGLLAGVLEALATGDGHRVEATVNAGGHTHAFRFTATAPSAVAGALQALDDGSEGPAPRAPDIDAFDPYSSQPRAWRERGMDLRLEGRRDPATGEVLFPAPPASPATAQLEPFRLGRSGRVFTHTRDHVFPFGGPLTMAVVELDGGGRFFGQVADGLDVEIGQDVDLVLRRLHTGGGIPQYFWKVSPRARQGAETAAAGRV